MLRPPSFSQLAVQHSATCFFNALLREWSEFKIVDSPARIAGETGCAKCVQLSLDNEFLLVPLKYISALGRHSYGTGFYVLKSDHAVVLTNFMEAVRKLTDYISRRFDTNEAQKNIFISRVGDSLQNIEKTLAHRFDDLQDMTAAVKTFRGAEQSLVIGHNFHPTPKSRDEFSDADFLKYSSEMGSGFELNWFLVRPEILFLQKAHSYPAADINQMFLKSFAAVEIAQDLLAQGWQALPVHPWQREQLLKRADVQKYLGAKRLIDFGTGNERWFATSSTRTIYSPEAPYMLKFSLSVRLTNSIRHLLPAEVVRGLQVVDVLATPQGQQFTQEHKDFHILLEPFFAALKNTDGQPITESVVVWRENSFRNGAQAASSAASVVPLASLAQDGLYAEKNLIQEYIENGARTRDLSLEAMSHLWFKQYLQVALRPLVEAQANYGIMMGAHQQNLLLEINDDLPVRAYFRDCQGTGYSSLGYESFAKQVQLIDKANGNILDERTGSYLFSYYLIVNSTFNVIAAIANLNWLSEADLIADLRQELLAIRAAGPKDTSCLDYLLFGKEILQKGNFLCCFKNINENTAANPLAIYNPITNPLYQEKSHA